MSKQSKKRRHKHRKHRDKLTWQIVCPRCGSVEDGTVPSMLTALMDMLNSCRDYGVKVKIHHGVILAEGSNGGGYVLPLPDGRFTARDMTYDRFTQVPVVSDDLDD